MLLVWLALIIAPAHAVTLSDLSIDYERLNPGSRVLEIPIFRPKESLGLSFEARWGYLRWRNRIGGMTDDGGYKYVEWASWLGVEPCPAFQAYYHHRSGHALDHPDTIYPQGKFPVQDGLGFRWRLLP